MWGGRFAEGPAAIMREINASIPFDKALWRQDIAASKAHVAMLGACGIVSSDDAVAIGRGLDQVAAEYERDGVPEDWALEDIHMTTESRLADLGLLYLDAPISGGAARAASGEMTVMAAGAAAAFDRAGPVLDAMAAKVYRLGDQAGAGSKVKVINQLLAGVHIAAAAEAMALGLREGVDPAALYDVITHSAGNSWMFENRMPHVLAADYTPLSAVDIFVKDLGLVLDLARASKFPLPLSSTAHQMFMQASSAGHGKEDDSAVIKIFPGIDLPRAG